MNFYQYCEKKGIDPDELPAWKFVYCKALFDGMQLRKEHDKENGITNEVNHKS